MRYVFSVYEIEKKIKTAEKFCFPFFETINWFAGRRLLQQINELNVEERKCPNTLLVGLKGLMATLKQWNTEKDVSITHLSFSMIINYLNAFNFSTIQTQENKYRI